VERSASGWINGFIGVVIFAGSLPATRLAVLQLDAGFVTAARATIAAVLGLGLLLLRQPWPRRGDLPGLVVVSLGWWSAFRC
jgi:drug/metabolite transporter (DMT)-like permease